VPVPATQREAYAPRRTIQRDAGLHGAAKTEPKIRQFRFARRCRFVASVPSRQGKHGIKPLPVAPDDVIAGFFPDLSERPTETAIESAPILAA
jgi:hypothetical protein